MSATLVAIDNPAPPADDYNHRKRELHNAVFDIWQAIPHGAHPTSQDRDDLFRALCDYVRFVERRTRALERACRNLLASDALTGDQRAELLTKLYGVGATTRDARILSENERDLLALHRGLSSDDKRLFRTVLTRLVQTQGGVS